MNRATKRLLFWAPRILCILFAGFISLFAADVFGAGYGFWGTIFALLMHLIPTAVIVAVLIVAWRWEWVGALLFFAAGGYYTLTALKHPDWILAIGGPVFVIAVLFLMNWLYRKELRAAP